MNPQGALLFLLFLAFDIYIFLVLTRFLLQLVRADFYNPVSQFVVKATNPPLKPLRKLVPGYGGVDVAALVVVLALILVKLLVWVVVKTGGLALPPLDLLEAVVLEVARLLLDYIFWAVLLRVILSFLVPDPYNPMVRVLAQITEPVMAPARRLLPPMGGFDLSPMLVLAAIFALEVLLGFRPAPF